MADGISGLQVTDIVGFDLESRHVRNQTKK